MPLLLALAACAAAPVGQGKHASPTPPGTVALGGGAWLLPGHYAPPRQPDGNSLLFAGPGGWLVVDTGRHPAHAQAILAAVHDSGRPIRHVLNTHWHLDHVGGNPALRAAHPGLRVLASPAIHGARAGFLAGYADQLRGLLAAPPAGVDTDALHAELARIEAGEALLPDEAVSAGGGRELAGRRVQLGLAPDAVTAADLWLFDPASGVLAAGDLVTLPAPFFDTACPRGWSAALQALEAQPFTTLVPGHGAPMDRAGFVTWRGAFESLRACAASPAPASDCAEGWLRQAAPLLPDEAARMQARALLDYYLAQVLRGPSALRHCADAGERAAAARPAR